MALGCLQKNGDIWQRQKLSFCGKRKCCQFLWYDGYFSKIVLRQVKSNRCLRVEFITVNQNTLCRFVCVCRTDMGERALESPDLGLCFKYPHHGCWMPRKFFTGPQRSGSHFFLSLVHSVEENLEISWSQKSEFWWSKSLEKKFFVNVSEVFGTWKDDVWDVFSVFQASEHL